MHHLGRTPEIATLSAPQTHGSAHGHAAPRERNDIHHQSTAHPHNNYVKTRHGSPVRWPYRALPYLPTCGCMYVCTADPPSATPTHPRGPPSGHTVDAVDDTPQGESQNDCTYAQTKQIDPPSTHNHYDTARSGLPRLVTLVTVTTPSGLVRCASASSAFSARAPTLRSSSLSRVQVAVRQRRFISICRCRSLLVLSCTLRRHSVRDARTGSFSWWCKCARQVYDGTSALWMGL